MVPGPRQSFLKFKTKFIPANENIFKPIFDFQKFFNSEPSFKRK